MKHFLLIALLISTFSGVVYAEEIDTECDQMNESRETTKQDSSKQKEVKTKSDGSTAQ